MIKPICAISLLAATALTTMPTAALAGQRQGGSQRATATAVARGNHARAVNNVHQSIYQIYLGSPSPTDWGYGYGDWSNPQSQISNQQATANAIATGNDATAISNINQVNHQNYQTYPDNWVGADYWGGGYGAVPQDQFSNQQANGTAVAEGDHSTAVNNINQSAYEDYLMNPGYWGYGY